MIIGVGGDNSGLDHGVNGDVAASESGGLVFGRAVRGS